MDGGDFDVIRHLLSAADFPPRALRLLVNHSVAIAAGRAGGRPLAGKTVGIYFRKTSTRTRTAFTVGAAKLGASIVTYGPGDRRASPSARRSTS